MSFMQLKNEVFKNIKYFFDVYNASTLLTTSPDDTEVSEARVVEISSEKTEENTSCISDDISATFIAPSLLTRTDTFTSFTELSMSEIQDEEHSVCSEGSHSESPSLRTTEGGSRLRAELADPNTTNIVEESIYISEASEDEDEASDSLFQFESIFDDLVYNIEYSNIHRNNITYKFHLDHSKNFDDDGIIYYQNPQNNVYEVDEEYSKIYQVKSNSFVIKMRGCCCCCR